MSKCHYFIFLEGTTWKKATACINYECVERRRRCFVFSIFPRVREILSAYAFIARFIRLASERGSISSPSAATYCRPIDSRNLSPIFVALEY